MECAKIRELLSEYIDGILDEQTKARVDKHLLTCEDCTEELASLRAVVDKLGSLESVEAPGDFLDKLHQRMEPGFTFRKLVQTLFVPVYVKIPLEAATAVAMVVLILAVWNAQQPEKQIAQVPQDSAHVMLAKKTTADRVKPTAKEEAYRLEPALQEATSQPSERVRETIELALLIEPEVRAKAYAPQAGREAPPAPEEIAKRSDEEKPRIRSPSETRLARQAAPEAEMKTEELSGENRALESAEGERSPSRDEAEASLSDVDEVLSEVENLIGLVDGTVISVEYEKQTQWPQSISAKIPMENYQAFTEKLKRLAVLKPAPPTISEKDQRVVHVRIRFITSE